jgi:hypothetical protein
MNRTLHTYEFNGRTGFVLPLVLVLGSIVLLLAFALVFMVQTESKLTNKYVDYSIAELVAESGVNQTLFYLKSHRETNKQLVDAMRNGVTAEISLPDELKEEVTQLSFGRGSVAVNINVNYVPAPSPYPDEGHYNGDIRIESLGIYANPVGDIAQKKILAVYGVQAMYMGIVAPDHALFLREEEHLNYRFEDSIEPSDLHVYNGDVYIKNGITAELSDYNKQRMIEKGELTLEEYYYMDHPSTSLGLADGGVDFLDSDVVEYENNGILRKFTIFGQEVTEKYANNVYPTSGFYNNQTIKLRDVSFYKDVAKVRIEPTLYSNNGRVSDNRYFQDVVFEGEGGYNSVKYDKVMPLYGWGDWRKVPPFDPERYGEPSRKWDMSNAINVDGVSFVRGDVFIEGWFDGVGLLVVQGNVYIGGSLKALDYDYSGHPSLLNILVFEDSSRETGYELNERDYKTGMVIIKPHPDNDWSPAGGVDPDPLIGVDAAVYAQNGMKTDKEAWRDNWGDMGSFDLTMKHNFVADNINMMYLPHDLFLKGQDPDEEFREKTGMSLEEYLQPDINIIMKAWVVSTAGNQDVNESVSEE